MQVSELLRIHVKRMGIELREHAFDGAFDQLGVVRLVGVVGADPLQHLVEAAELTVQRLCRCRGLLALGRADDR